MADENIFSRNTWLTLQEREALKNKKVMTIGCGGVGWIINLMLYGTGIGEICAVDSDVIETVNLNRLIGIEKREVGVAKVDALSKRADCIKGVKTLFPDKRSLEIMAGADLIIGAVDNVKSRMAIQNFVLNLNKNYIDIGVGFKICSKSRKVREAWGQVIVVKEGWPCLVEHGFEPDSDERGYTCGQSFEGLAELLNASSVTINSILSALGAEIALKVLLAKELTFNRIDYDHLKFTIDTEFVQKDENCVFCQKRRREDGDKKAWRLGKNDWNGRQFPHHPN